MLQIQESAKTHRPTQPDSEYTVPQLPLFQSSNIRINREVTTTITELLKMKCKKEELAEIIQAGKKNGQISVMDSKLFHGLLKERWRPPVLH